MIKILSFFIFLTMTNGPFLFAMDDRGNDAKSSASCEDNVENIGRPFALSDNDSDTSSAGFEPEQPFKEWAKQLDVNNYPDPNLFPVPEGVATEEDYKKFWQQKTGLVIKHFSGFTIPQK